MKVQMNNPRSVGDALHYVNIASTVAFASLVVYDMTRMALRNDHKPAVFDPYWVKTGGFCITNPSSDGYWNSHDMCLYVDCALAAVAFVLYMVLKDKPGMSNTSTIYCTNIMGVIVHGMAHASAGEDFRKNYHDGFKLSRGFLEHLNNYYIPEFSWGTLINLLFWTIMMKAAMGNVSFKYTSIPALVACYVGFYVPRIYGFTYVQTVLLLAFSSNQLARPTKEKDWAYALYPAFVSLPLLAVGCMEGLACKAFVKDYFYGHVMYDAWIPIGMMAWYVTVYHLRQSEETTTKKEL